MEVFSNKYLIINHLKDNEFLDTYWITNAYMEDEIYRQCLLNYLEAVQKYHPAKVLINAQNSYYSIPSNTQEWINDNIYPQAIQAGVKQLTYVLGEDFYLLLSLELIVEDTDNVLASHPFQQLFFKDLDAAKE